MVQSSRWAVGKISAMDIAAEFYAKTERDFKIQSHLPRTLRRDSKNILCIARGLRCAG